MITRSQSIPKPPEKDYLSEIKLLLKESLNINAEIQNITKHIVPLEFESYAEYFIINTFKKGKSESGRVDVLDMKYRNHSKYYQKIRNPNNYSNTVSNITSSTPTKNNNNSDFDTESNKLADTSVETTVTPPPSHSSSLEYLHKLNNLIKSSNSDNTNFSNNNGNQAVTDSNSETTQAAELEDIYDNIPEYTTQINVVDSYIRKENILHTSDIGSDSSSVNPPLGTIGNRRRSSRISKMQEQKRLEEIQRREHLRKQILAKQASKNLKQSEKNSNKVNTQNNTNDTNSEESNNGSRAAIKNTKYQEQTNIRDLYESLVPKVKVPNRRSDWVLPPKLKYQPEKQMRTKVVFDSIKVHELIDTDRIMKVLSRFEGGVAGIRKTFSNSRSNISTSNKKMG